MFARTFRGWAVSGEWQCPVRGSNRAVAAFSRHGGTVAARLVLTPRMPARIIPQYSARTGDCPGASVSLGA